MRDDFMKKTVAGQPAGAGSRAVGWPRFAALFLVLAVPHALGPIPSLFAQTLPLDDKARYEKSQEAKVEEILLKLLGPNQAKVVVQAFMDFTRTEKVDMTAGAGTAADRKTAFKWQNTTAETQPFNDYLLPGFPSLEYGASGAQSYQRQTLFPTSFVKRLSVTVIVDRDMTDPQVQNVRTVVSDVLGLNQERGDELSIIKMPFAPFWKTLWYSPDSLNLVFKYGILTIMGIVAMIVVSIGFLKLAAAMNTMAKVQQSHQITMDIGKGMSGVPGVMEQGEGKAALEPGRGEHRAAEEGGAGETPPGEKVVFNVRPDQLVFLVQLMSSEAPANVAIVASHLAPDVRSGFLRLLPPKVSSLVVSHMAKVRFVDPDIINNIKEELEKRLSGALGGVQLVIESLGQVNLRAKKELILQLSQDDPETAALLRKKIFLPEDLGWLSDRDMSLLISSCKIEAIASAMWEFPPPVQDRIKKQMAEKTWQMVEQTMKYGAPSRDTAEKAAEELVATALRLIQEGRISNPLEEGKPDAAAPRPALAGLPAAEPLKNA